MDVEDIQNQIRTIFGGLAVTGHKNILQAETVQVIHQSVKDYVITDNCVNTELLSSYLSCGVARPNPAGAKFSYIEPKAGHLLLHQACLSYLKTKEIIAASMLQKGDRDFPIAGFFQYATKNWIGHLQAAENVSGKPQLQNATIDWVLCSDGFNVAKHMFNTSIYSNRHTSFEFFSEIQTPLQSHSGHLRPVSKLVFACAFGSHDTVESHVKNVADINESGGILLQAASLSRYSWIMTHLLNLGAKIHDIKPIPYPSRRESDSRERFDTLSFFCGSVLQNDKFRRHPWTGDHPSTLSVAHKLFDGGIELIPLRLAYMQFKISSLRMRSKYEIEESDQIFCTESGNVPPDQDVPLIKRFIYRLESSSLNAAVFMYKRTGLFLRPECY